MQRKPVAQRVNERRAGRLWLHGGHVAAPANPVAESKVARRDKLAVDAPLTLACTHAPKEVVGVHRGKLPKEHGDGGVVPSGGRKAPLREQVAHPRLPRAKLLRALRNVRRVHETLGEGKVLGVHGMVFFLGVAARTQRQRNGMHERKEEVRCGRTSSAS